MTAPNESSGQGDQTAFVATLANNLVRYRLLPSTLPPSILQASGRKTDAQPLVIGVSGGADSVGLLHAMVGLSKTLNVRVHVAHVDHGLRFESAAEARFVRALSDRLECQFFGTTLDADALRHQAGGLEAAARNARYAYLCQVANNVTDAHHVPIVATAHHADDQAETLLLHLIRGSGLRGLGGIRWKSEVTAALYGGATESDRPVCLIRPLLNLRREAIRAYLQQHQLFWREDASNVNTSFTRNYLRSEVMPRLEQINPQVVAAFCRTAEIAADDAERLASLDREHLARLTVEPAKISPTGAPVDRVVLDLHGLMDLSRADQRGVLRVALARLAHQIETLDFETVERLLDQLPFQKTNSGPHTLAADVSWSVLVVAIAGGSKEHWRLSLHRTDALPRSPRDAPQLDQDLPPVRLTPGGEASGDAGGKAIVDGWRLLVDEVSVSDLPPSWRHAPPWEAWLDADCLSTPALMRPSSGMVIAPLGMHGRSKSVGDLFTDAKIHPALRPGWPVIVDEDSGTVLWVCGLRVAHGSRITERTRRMLHFVWKRAQ